MRRYGWWAVLFSAVVFLFFFQASRIPLFSGDEGRYGEVAREMLETGDFITPQFNYVAILEKPILAHFLTAISFAIFGVNALAARLPSILAALAGIAMTFLFARRFFGARAASWSASVLATSIGYIAMGRIAMIDMLLTLFMSAAFFCLMNASLTRKKYFYDLAYVAMGLAMITKGLIGVVLPLVAHGIFLAVTDELSEIRHIRLGRGLLIIALIFVPWGIAVSMKEPEFSYVFFMQHQFGRFATGSFGRRKPFWFFLPLLLLLYFPWSCFLPAAIRDGLRRSAEPERKKVWFLVIWIAVIFIFFSIPKSKLVHYILPLSMPVAVLVGLFLEGLTRSETRSVPHLKELRQVMTGLAIFCVVAILGANVCLFRPNADERLLAVGGLVRVFSVILLLVGYLSSRLYRRMDLRSLMGVWAGTVCTAVFVMALGVRTLSPYLSTSDYADTLRPILKGSDIVAMYSSPDHFSDLPFHLKRRVMVVGTDRGTLTDESREEGNDGQNAKWFLDSSAFVQLFETGSSRIFCLMDADRLGELVHIGLDQYTVLKAGYGKLLISNRPAA